ncbi:pilus assembly protein TadG-related protein [Propionibacteriaceae bacterium Y1923]|uniref:pilus assembly protein TadG-related protein n=1 Tax=Aestuariimicrobium sp. Y1814 TaxID=3418742 RepID=UPI003C226B0E
MPRQSFPSRRRSERGASVTALFATVMVVLLVAVGLVVDGGAQSAARSRAETVAAEAARAAVSAHASDSIQGGPAAGGARAAAQRVLDARGMPGTITITGGRVTVETSTSTPTTFLSLLGINSLTARGSATAQLVDS